MILEQGIYEGENLRFRIPDIDLWIDRCINRDDYNAFGLRYEFIGEGNCECGTKSFYYRYEPVFSRYNRELFIVIVLTEEDIERHLENFTPE